jgi:hypothetical protein
MFVTLNLTGLLVLTAVSAAGGAWAWSELTKLWALRREKNQKT